MASSAAFVWFEGGSSLLTQKASVLQTCFSKSVDYVDDGEINVFRILFLKDSINITVFVLTLGISNHMSDDSFLNHPCLN